MFEEIEAFFTLCREISETVPWLFVKRDESREMNSAEEALIAPSSP